MYSLHITDNKIIDIEESYLVLTEEASGLNEFKVQEDGSIKVSSDYLRGIRGYRNLLKRIEGKYKSSFDMFGGVGVTARMFSADNVITFVNDLDPNCVGVLRDNFRPRSVFNLDVTKIKVCPSVELIVADFDDLTLKKSTEKYANTLKLIFDQSSKYVILNECSIFYLKYGKRSYEVYSALLGKSIANQDEFLDALKAYYENLFPKFTLIKLEYFNNTCLCLFEKHSTADKWGINKVEKGDEQFKITRQ